MAAAAVTLRSGRLEDASALRDLTWRLTISHPIYGDQARAKPEAVEAPTQALSGGGVIVAETGRRPVGYIAVLPGEGRTEEVDGLFVDAAFQRQGVGTRLLQAAADEARRRGATGLRVVSAPDATPVYETFGFGDPEATPTLFGPAVTLRLALNAD